MLGIMEKDNNLIKDGYYAEKVRENSRMIIICVLLAILITLISYPGFFYTDSVSRVNFAKQFGEILSDYFAGKPRETESWLTVIPQIFIFISMKITGGIGLYTFTQAFLAYLTVALLFKKINKTHYIIFTLILFCCPFFFCNGVFYEAGVGSLIGIIWLFLFIRTFNKLKRKEDYAIWMISIVFWSFIAFGYRANTMSVLPVILIIIAVTIKKIWKYIGMALVVFGMMLTSIIPNQLHINTMSSGTAGIAWEIVMTVKNLPDDKQERYIDYLDEVGGDGATKEAVESINNRNVCSLTVTRFDHIALSQPGMTKVILSKYLELLKKEPRAWIKTKLYIIGATLGITEPLDHVAWIYNQYDKMEDYNFNNSIARYNFYQSYMDSVKVFGVCLKPYILYLLGLILGIIGIVCDKVGKREIHIEEEIWLYIVAVFYYGAFCLDTQAFELRYFYPAFILIIVSEISVIFKLIDAIFKEKCYTLFDGHDKLKQTIAFISKEQTIAAVLIMIFMLSMFLNVRANSNKVYVADYTDQNWKNGIAIDDTSELLFYNTVSNYSKLQDVTKIYCGDKKFDIVKMYNDTKWIYVFVEGDGTACAYPYPLTVK